MIQLILYIAGFILLSGILAMVDAAVLSVSPAEVETMAGKHKRGAGSLKKLYAHIPRAVVVIVAFTNTVNVFGPILVGRKAVDLYGDLVIGAITAVLTFGTIVFSEIIPKSLGVHYAPAISRFAAPFIRFFTYALFPLVVFLEWLSKLMQRGQRHVGTEDQISALVKLGGSAGLIEKDEIQLINRVFTLNDSTAEQIMTPLKQICSLPSDMTVWEAAEIVVARRFSRFPVLGAGSGEIVGYVLARDILEAAYRGETDRRVCEVSAGIPEVELSDTSDDLLPLFRELKLHMAVVRKAGRTIGIVTLEDVLEELVGEIWDETDA